MLDSATVSIDAQYFLWLEDAVGSLLFERLIEAAERGVRVRLMVDDSFLAGEDKVLLAIDEHPNIEVRIFNPFAIRSKHMVARFLENVNDYSRTNHRMHNKLLVADGTVAIVGGRNIADEYFGFGKVRNFRDYDLLTAGRIVPELSSGFDAFWNSGWSLPVPEVTHRYANDKDFNLLRTELRSKAAVLDAWQTRHGTNTGNWSTEWEKIAPTMIEGRAEVLLDLPRFDKELPVQVADRLSDEFMKVDGEIFVVTAYLVPTTGMIEEFQNLENQGTSVKILTNSLSTNNHLAAHTAYEHHRKQLLNAGVELYELRPDGLDRAWYEAPGFVADHFGLHGKVIIFGEDNVYVGTLNLDPRSMILNTEMGLLIDSPALNREIRKELVPGLSMRNSWYVQLGTDGELNWRSHDGTQLKQPGKFSRRLMDSILKPIPMDSQM